MSKPKTIVVTPFWLHVIAVTLTILTILSIMAIDTVVRSGYGYELLPLFLFAFTLIAWFYVVIYWVQRALGYIR
jgi:hypothetical protein